MNVGIVKKFFDYWIENIKFAKAGHGLLPFVCGVFLWIIWAVCKVGDLIAPNFQTISTVGSIGSGFFYFAWCFVRLPIRPHEIDKISHAQSVYLLNQEISRLKTELQANVVNLKISAELSLENTTNIH
jgi:hypothetical protein